MQRDDIVKKFRKHVGILSLFFLFGAVVSGLEALARLYLSWSTHHQLLRIVKQGRIHGHPSRVRLGRSSVGEGH